MIGEDQAYLFRDHFRIWYKFNNEKESDIIIHCTFNFIQMGRLYTNIPKNTKNCQQLRKCFRSTIILWIFPYYDYSKYLAKLDKYKIQTW